MMNGWDDVWRLTHTDSDADSHLRNDVCSLVDAGEMRSLGLNGEPGSLWAVYCVWMLGFEYLNGRGDLHIGSSIGAQGDSVLVGCW